MGFNSAFKRLIPVKLRSTQSRLPSHDILAPIAHFNHAGTPHFNPNTLRRFSPSSTNDETPIFQILIIIYSSQRDATCTDILNQGRTQNFSFVGGRRFWTWGYIQDVQLKSGLYFNMSHLFTKIYNMAYYTTNLYLQ